MKKTRKNRKGFTLVELMVVVVIIGILTAIAIPVYMAVTDNAAEKACKANQRTIDSAVMAYLAADPTHTIADLTTNPASKLVPDYIAIWPECPDCTDYTVAATGLCKIDTPKPGHPLKGH